MRKICSKIFLLMLVFWVGWIGTAYADNAIAVNKIGTGFGTVVSTSDGGVASGTINCGSVCGAAFPPVFVAGLNGTPDQYRNVNVILTAVPGVGSVFTGWTGAGASCGQNLACILPATLANQNVTAEFTLGTTPTTPISFTIINEGSGSDYGSVVSSPAGITCNGVKFGSNNTDCTEGFAPGTGVTLNANVNKDNGAFFSGWEVYFATGTLYTLQTNMCLNLEPTCNVTVPFNITDIRVRAKFDLGYILTLQRQGEGAGSLLSSSDNLQTNCADALCTQTYNANRTVTITGITTSTSKLVGWTVDGLQNSNCPDTALTCTVTMDKAHLVAAKFDKVISGSYTATLLKEGSGTGFSTVVGKIVKASKTTQIIDCGATCSGSVNQSDSVRFEATPDKTGVTFAGWKVRFWDPVNLKWVDYPDMCTGLQPYCEVTVTQNVQVMARFDYDIILTVVRDGNGSGMISTSSQALNACSAASTKTICDQTFVGGQDVTLTAIPELKSRFVKWNGCDSTKDGNADGSQEICLVTMANAKLVTATFEAINSARLSVTPDPNSTGTGTVKSDLLGLDCGTICNRNYAFDTVVTLTATPFPGSEFVGWGGDWCSGAELTCKVKMDQAKDVTARFDAGFKLTLNKQGEGDGLVLSDPTGINCGTTCAYSFAKATQVTLTAKSVNGSTFLGWGGACTGTQLTCTVNMTKAQEVAVTFSGVGLGKALDNKDLVWKNTGDAPWFGQLQKDAKVKTTYFAGSAGVSGLITHSQSSSVETTVFGPVEFSFYWKVSSEENRDELRFEVDGKTINKISGEKDWAQVKQTLAAGKHVLKWTYAKDEDLSQGADSAWLEQVKVSEVAGSATPNKLTILNQGSGTVVSKPAGISCGGACSADFALDTAVLLTANAIGDAKFGGWSGACSGSAATCLVTMKGSQTVVASFESASDQINKAALQLGLLNDTGIDWCANKTTQFMVDKDVKCEALLTTFPGQDGQLGRDAAARKGQLTKIGNGEAGFDYTKICNNGQAEGNSNCSADQTTLGDASNQWGCTRDNMTGLIWEVKTLNGSRDKDKTYSWYNANDRQNGGSKGDNCTGADCNTDAYVKSVNKAGLCGANDWRLPTRSELHSMVHHGRSNPSVDITYFPNTASDGYWTATPVANTPFNAWLVNFEAGWDFWDSKANKQHVRLVRKCESCELPTMPVNPSYRDARLHLPEVRVESDYYEADLQLVSAEPMVFQLGEAKAKKAVGRSVSGDQVRYYLNGLLVVKRVEVGQARYDVTLQVQPGSNPLRFTLLGATPSK